MITGKAGDGRQPHFVSCVFKVDDNAMVGWPHCTPDKLTGDGLQTDNNDDERPWYASGEFRVGGQTAASNEYWLVLPKSRQNEAIRVSQGLQCGQCRCDNNNVNATWNRNVGPSELFTRLD